MVLLAVIALSSWALTSPVGSSPDDDFHLASIWCSATAPDAGCVRHGDSVSVPAWTVAAPGCFAFHPDTPASCQDEAALAGTATTSAARANLTGSYPPGFYLALGLLVGPDVPASVYAMRIADAALLVLLFAVALALAPPAVRQAGLLGLLVVGGPLGWFLFASTNPSAWAVGGSGALVISVLGYLLHDDDRRATRMLIPAAIAVLLCVSSRADAAGYAAIIVVAAAIAALLRPGTPRRRRRVLLAAAAAVLVALAVALAMVGQASTGVGGAGGTVAPLGVDVRNVINLPYLLLGSIGFWGLGWLDTRMPIGLPIAAALALGGIVMLGLGRVPRWMLPGIAIAVAALVVLPLRVLHARGLSIGEFVQPRYMLPLLLAVVMMILAPPTATSMLRLTRTQLGAVSVVVLAVFSVGLVVNAQRYATGLHAAKFDISAAAEWWSTDRVSPNQTVGLGILAGAGFLALAWRYLRPSD